MNQKNAFWVEHTSHAEASYAEAGLPATTGTEPRSALKRTVNIIRFMSTKRNCAELTSKGIEQTLQSDQPLDSLDPEEKLILLRVLDEAMARTSDEIHALSEDLANIPLLFGRSDGFKKRMADVQAGKKETVNLPSHLKRFMKENFPDYRFDKSDPEWLWFRKSLRPTLDVLLRFDKVFQWGLGKSFTIAVGVDFPGTPLRLKQSRHGGMIKNLFWIFHESWEQKVWTYTTSTELATALQGCRDLLSRVLPVLEKYCCDLLQPQPIRLPPGIQELGALTAREAYDLVLPMAREWAADAEMESINAVPVTEVGRLRPEADWRLKFVSKGLDRYCWYIVPYTGRVWWDYYPVMQNAIPKYSSALNSEDWLDSADVAPSAFQALKEQLGTSKLDQVSLALCDPTRYSGNFVWRAISYCGSLPKERNVTVHLDWRSGAVLDEGVP